MNSNYIKTVLAFAIITANIILDHFWAPVGILISPIITALAALMINFDSKIPNIFIRSVLTFFVVALNDIGIKLYGGGIHDTEGMGVMNLFFMICAATGFVIFVACNFDLSLAFKGILSVALFVLLAFLHLHFFGWLGLGRAYI
ncbi:MAG: hypothetical protein EOP46_19170 [Sphingobacteriaceae bacterium]|nr:MAG: hypothetical protein EOP46_19170 [Sphingobacteriaceae bacterium]